MSRRTFRREGVRRMLATVFEDLHAARLDSMARYSTAIMHAARASIAAIGAAYAELEELKPKHGIKQVDRFLSNKGIDVAGLTPHWVRFVLGGRPDVIVGLDWTEFDDDDHAVICAYVVTTHGRATPLVWTTVKKSQLKDQRTAHEHALSERLHDAIPADVGVTLLADRGFGDQVLYATLATLGWEYVIRFRGVIQVEHDGVLRPAEGWLSSTGRARKLEGARVTQDRTEIGAVVVVHDKRMKEPGFLQPASARKPPQRSSNSTAGASRSRRAFATRRTSALDSGFALPISATQRDATDSCCCSRSPRRC